MCPDKLTLKKFLDLHVIVTQSQNLLLKQTGPSWL